MGVIVPVEISNFTNHEIVYVISQRRLGLHRQKKNRIEPLPQGSVSLKPEQVKKFDHVPEAARQYYLNIFAKDDINDEFIVIDRPINDQEDLKISLFEKYDEELKKVTFHHEKTRANREKILQK